MINKIAYHGAPEKAYEVFVSALLTKKLNYSSLKEQNPAGVTTYVNIKLLVNIIIDVIMDILGQPKLRKTILEYYENSPEPNKVRRAVQFGINQEESDRGLLRTALFGAKNVRISWLNVGKAIRKTLQNPGHTLEIGPVVAIV